MGRKENGRGPRLEILTPLHWFRYSKGYTNGIRRSTYVIFFQKKQTVKTSYLKVLA